MRTSDLGATAPVKNWSSRFKKPAKPRKKAEPRRGNAIMSYVPTQKGEPRMERLRRYFHCDMAALLETDPEVLDWTAEPKAYALRGEQAPFRPDMVARTVHGVRAIRLLDCKSDGKRPSERQKTMTLKMREHGVTLEFHSQSELADDPLVRNAKDLLYHRYRDHRDELPMAVVREHHQQPVDTLGELHRRLGGGEELWTELLALAAKGFIIIDLTVGLDADTPVRDCKLRGYCE